MKVMIAGGGTGGHLFSGIAVAEALRERDLETSVLMVGTRRGLEAKVVPQTGLPLAFLPVRGLRRKGLVGLIVGLLSLPWSLFLAFLLVRKFSPEVAVSVGGYAAGPAVLAAKILGVPCVVIEQNAVAGLTNRVLARLARRVVVPFATRAFAARKVSVLGNPVRRSLIAVRERAYEPRAPLRLLVLGGSLGARAINEVMMAAASRLRDFSPALSIVHQAGAADEARVRAAYERAGVSSATACAFIDDMAAAYRDADLVLCRAGATTVAELCVCGLPAILVPYPFAVDDHQSAHARLLAEAGAALHLPQTEMSLERLLALIGALAGSPSRLCEMAARARALGKPDAAADIAALIAREARHV